MSKKPYQILFLLILIAIAVGILLRPGPQEIALMQIKDKRFEAARDTYEKLLERGKLTLEVADALTELYLQSGAIDKAIGIMEKFIAEHPDHIEARQTLGTLYQYAERNEDYLRNLEEINRINPSPATLKALSDIYNFNAQYEKQAETLRKLIDIEQGARPEPFSDLATILAAQHRYADAILVLQELRKLHPQEFGFRQSLLLVSLLFEDKRPEEAYAAADSRIQTNPDAVEAAQLINMVHFRGSPFMAEKLMGRFTEAQIEASPALLEEYTLLQLAQGRDEEIYQRLKTLHSDGQLSPESKQRLLFLAVMRRDTALAHQMLEGIELSELTEPQLLALVELSLATRDETLLKNLTHTFTSPQESRPLLTTALAVANRRNAQAHLVHLDTIELPNERLLQLAGICVLAARVDCAEHLIGRLPEARQLSDAEIVRVSQLYLDMRRWDKGYAYLEPVLQTRPSPAIEAVAVQFHAARGDTARVEGWLKQHGTDVNANALADLYFAARNHKHFPTAEAVAKFFNELHHTPLSRSLLADAYVQTGQFEPAVQLLRDVSPRTQDDENNYLSALSRLSRHHPSYRKELADYATARLRNPDLSQREKLALVYALVNAKQAGSALPAIRELALAQGGEWAALYAQELDRQGRHEEARRFWVNVASQKSTPVKERAIAYNLLDHGYKDDAAAIFSDLASGAGKSRRAANDDIDALLYLWGPRPTEAQMRWLETRYTQATGQDQPRWADRIASAATPGYLAGFVERHPESLRYSSIAGGYLQALAAGSDFAGQIDHMIAQAKETKDTTLLRHYARAAQENGLARKAAEAYEALIMIHPADTIALRQAGTLAYEQADYLQAALYLGEYAEAYMREDIADPESYRAFFYYGELLRRHRQMDAAPLYYHAAVELINGLREPAPEVLAVKAQSQIWSGNPEAGFKTFDEARAKFPQDDALRADLISTLIELGQYDEARTLLAAPPVISIPDEPVALPGWGDKAASHTLLSRDRELLVRSKRPVGRPGALAAASFKTAPGVDYVQEGYDSLLVAAKPGYKFSFTGDSIRLIPDRDAAAHRSAGQTLLRYELMAARLDLETGRVYHAARRLNSLLPQYPDDPQLLGFAANAENYGGNWPRAGQLLATASALAPENEDIARFKRDVRRLHAQHVMLDYVWQKRGSSHDHITSLSGHADVTDHLQAGLLLADDRVIARNVRRADGRVGKFTGHRQQGELFLRLHGENGQLATLSLFANNDTPGTGFVFGFLNPLGETAITAEWHRPYWEFAETVLDDAVRDRLALKHTVKPTTRLTLSVEPGINRYDTDAVDKVMTSASVDALAVYRLIDEQPFLAVAYGIGAEYDLSHKKGIDATGDFTRLFPLVSRELHFISLNAGYEFTDRTYGEVLLGYGYDRLGGSGPTVEGRLTHEFTDRLDAQIRALYGMDTRATSADTSRVGAYARWRF